MSEICNFLACNKEGLGIFSSELQKLVDLPPNLKFMLSTFLILTQFVITGKQLAGVL